MCVWRVKSFGGKILVFANYFVKIEFENYYDYYLKRSDDYYFKSNHVHSIKSIDLNVRFTNSKRMTFFFSKNLLKNGSPS